MKDINEKISLKLVKIKDAKKLSNNSRWSPAQEIMQEWERFELQQKGVTDV